MIERILVIGTICPADSLLAVSALGEVVTTGGDTGFGAVGTGTATMPFSI